jgi:hypothetical protein
LKIRNILTVFITIQVRVTKLFILFSAHLKPYTTTRASNQSTAISKERSKGVIDHHFHLKIISILTTAKTKVRFSNNPYHELRNNRILVLSTFLLKEGTRIKICSKV